MKLALLLRCATRRCARRAAARADVTLLNVSYDPTRELYQDFNAAFAKHWQAKTGEKVIDQAVARRLGQAGALGDRRPRGRRRHAGARVRHRRDRRARRSCCRPTGRSGCRTTARPTPRPSCSWCARAIPKGIKDWDDLVKPGVAVITPNPKTSGGARWNYLAAWGYAQAQVRRRRQGAGVRRAGSTRTCRCSTPARAARRRRSSSAASATCCSRGRTRRSSRVKELGPDKFEIVVPSLSILAEPPVAVVDKNVDKKGTRKVAEAYLEYLYTRGRPGDRRAQLLPADRSEGRRRSTRSSSRR